MRRWHSGYETNTVVANATEWGSDQSLTNFTLVTDAATANPGLGIRYGRFTGQGHTGSPPGLSLTKAWAKAFVKVGAGTIATDFAMVLEVRNAAGAIIFYLALTMAGHLELRGASAVTVARASNFPRDTWTLVELFADLDTSFVEGRVNGVSFSGRVSAAPNAAGPIDHIAVGPSAAAPGVTINIDDLAVNDAVGPFNSSWCGADTIGLCVPTSDVGGSASWTAQGGGALYAAVDDLPGALDTGTYIKETSEVFGVSYQFTMTPLPAGALIGAVLVGMRGGGTSVAERRGFTQIIGHIAGGAPFVKYGDQTLNWNVSGWTTSYPALVMEREAWGTVTSEPEYGPWRMLTAEYLNNATLQIVRFTGTGELRMTALWASVAAVSLTVPAPPAPRTAPRILAELGP